MKTNNIIKIFDEKNRHVEIFDMENGLSIRTSVLDDSGNETGIDPFMASFPRLLDIGIMGKCSSVSSCPTGCYQQGGKNRLGKNMSLNFFKSLIDEIQGNTLQVALGGFGNPNEHEDFVEIIRYAREHNVVPNYTTSGINLTEDQIVATKKYCGAVAISHHRQPYTYEAIRRFVEHGVKTNIHYVIGNDSIDEAISRLENDDFPDGVNAVIFLLYKPVGKVKDGNTLSPRDPRVKRFYELIETEHPFKCGLDSCHVPGVVNFTTKILNESISPCDAARFSMYITPDGFALPCSFDTTHRNWAVDLNTTTIEEIWNGEVFSNFRQHQENSCSSCKLVSNCFGGCGLMANKINLCERDERDYVRNGV